MKTRTARKTDKKAFESIATGLRDAIAHARDTKRKRRSIVGKYAGFRGIEGRYLFLGFGSPGERIVVYVQRRGRGFVVRSAIESMMLDGRSVSELLRSGYSLKPYPWKKRKAPDKYPWNWTEKLSSDLRKIVEHVSMKRRGPVPGVDVSLVRKKLGLDQGEFQNLLWFAKKEGVSVVDSPGLLLEVSMG